MADLSLAPGWAELGPERPGGLRHAAFLYRSDGEYADALARFVRGALARENAVLVALPGARAGQLREALAADAWRVTFADMAELGRNPGRIIPSVRAFASRQAGRAFSYLGEPAWPGRSARELVEAAKHEALVNLAFAGMPATIVCPYAAELPARVLASARQTHPELILDGRRQASPGYLGPDRLPPGCTAPLPAPPPGTETLEYRTDLRPVRSAVTRYTELAGLPEDRAADLVLAVSELAANTLRHTPAGGRLRIWLTTAKLICETSDQGWITDPLAGRVRPPADDAGGHGLWLVNQVCDLVELRSGEQGTTVRLHMRRGGR